ncbi:MAG: MDR family oxidoreductase [Planctomycetota bacterium]
MTFRALVVSQVGDDSIETTVAELSNDQLPAGDVTVAVEYSTVNYKDGLCLQPKSKLVSHYPHVPGIDFAGTVEQSDDPRYQPGDQVVLTGWRVGETHWGGFSQKARVNADWLVPSPDGLTAKQSMAVGTAGLAAALAILSLEQHGLRQDHGEVLVTGAAGGVGSIGTAMLANRGYKVAAVTGRPEATEYLQSLGAGRIVHRRDIAEASKRPLESERWAGCLDVVGGQTLARVLGQLMYGASVAAVGLAGGSELRTNVMPFLLRGVNLLGIDSVMQPFETRMRAWQRIADDLPRDLLDAVTSTASLSDVPYLASKILDGQIKGRVVIDVNA